MAVLKRAQSAINNLTTDLAAKLAAASNLSDLANTTTARSNLGVYSTSSVDSAVALKLAIASNLSDLNSASTARTNLGVYSTTQVDTAIALAVTNAGTVYKVADITALEALTGVTTNDMVRVADDGDGNWAIWGVDTVNGSGVITAKTKLADYNGLANSLLGAVKTNITESLTISGDTVTANHSPSFVFNFSRASITVSGLTYEVPVTFSGATGTLAPDTANQFDTETAVIQYDYS